MQLANVTLKKKAISLRAHFILTLNHIRVTLFFDILSTTQNLLTPVDDE
jgi:hypothetical protein